MNSYAKSLVLLTAAAALVVATGCRPLREMPAKPIVLESATGRRPVSLVRFNGEATPVYYNDGDTFRPLAGPLRFTPARLAGFNTLESYGPAHKWGGWTYKELYVNAKMATYFARRGFWSCRADPDERDGYGRVLAKCKDLARAHLRRGFAHAMSIDGPASMDYIRAQREAIVERRGMWAKGVPPLIVTSLHSVDERFDDENNYNRLASPLDGYAGKEIKWYHQDTYSECEEVCHPAKKVSEDAALRVIEALRDDPDTEPIVHGYEDPYLMAMLNEYVTNGRVPRIFENERGERKGHEAVKDELDALRSEGVFGQLEDSAEACMVYATFERRYFVPPKPDCLEW